MYADLQRLEDISSIRDAMRQISQESQAVVELLDVRIGNEHLDGRTEAEDTDFWLGPSAGQEARIYVGTHHLERVLSFRRGLSNSWSSPFGQLAVLEVSECRPQRSSTDDSCDGDAPCLP